MATTKSGSHPTVRCAKSMLVLVEREAESAREIISKRLDQVLEEYVQEDSRSERDSQC